MVETIKFSERLRAFRNDSGLTQVALAQMLGVTPNYIGMLEAGQKPSGTLLKLFEVLERQQRTGGVSGDEVPNGAPRELMRRAREARGFTFKELAKLTRFRADVLQAIEEGTGQAPEKAIDAICAVLGLSKEQMMAGQDESIVRDALIGTYGATPNIEVIGGGRVKYVPLISMAQAGTMNATAFSDEGYSREGVLAFDVKDPRAFGVRITGDSMEKKYPAGSLAIVYPTHKPRPGRPVIARLKEDSGGGVVFKYFNPTEGGKRVRLTSENYQVHPEANYGIEEFEWIYPVANVVIEV